MNIPGFDAEASLFPTSGIYRGKAVFGVSVGANVIAAQALRDSAALQSHSAVGGGGGAGFFCGEDFCICAGIDDCSDMIITTNVCNPSSTYCTYSFGTWCVCGR